MASPKVSVIVPAYNAAGTLGRCVDSLRGQSLDDIEIILVDDGSTDATPRLCDQYAAADSRIRVIHQPNGGVASARNAGLDAARGRYVIHCDADDWVAPDIYKQLYDLALSTQAQLVGCDFISEYRGLSKVRRQSPSALTPDALIADIIAERVYGSVWNKLIDRRAIVDSGLRFDTRLRVYEDQCFLCLLLRSIRSIAHLPQPLYHYDCTNPMSLIGGKAVGHADSNLRRLEILLENFPQETYPELAFKYKRQAKLSMFVDHRRYTAAEVIEAYSEINPRLISEAPHFPHTEYFFKLFLTGHPRLGRALMRLKKAIRPIKAK